MRHDKVSKMLHWNSCEKWDFNKAENWYVRKLEKVLESQNCKILWDILIQIDKFLQLNRPDITVADKKNKEYILICPACPFDAHSDLKYEIAKIRKMRKVEVIPIVTGGLRTVTKHF